MKTPAEIPGAWCNGDIELGAVSVSFIRPVESSVFPKVNWHGNLHSLWRKIRKAGWPTFGVH